MFHSVVDVVDVISMLLLLPSVVLAWFAFAKKDSNSPAWDRFVIEFFWVLMAIGYLCSVLNPSGRSRIHQLLDLAAALYILAWRTHEWYRRRYPLIPSSEKLHKQWLADQQSKAEREADRVVKACLADIEKNGYLGTALVNRMEDVSEAALKIAQARFASQGWLLTYVDSNLVLQKRSGF